MPYLLIIIPACIAILFFFLGKNYGKENITKSGKIFALLFVLIFLLWLFLPSYIFGIQQEKYVTEILNKTGIPPTIAKILASILAVAYVAIIWFGKWQIKPMNFVYAIAFPPIIFLLLQFIYPNISKSCKAINPNTGKYEFCECDYPDKIHPIWGTPVIKNDGVLTPINADEKTVLFDKNGKGLYFYTQDANGKILLFDQEGYTPTGDKANNITPAIAKKYLDQIKSNSQPQINYQRIYEPQNKKIDTSLPIQKKSNLDLSEETHSLNSSNSIIPKASQNIISEYLIFSQNTNQIDGLLNEIQNSIELKGHSSTISNKQDVTISSLKGHYKRLLSINGSLITNRSSIDQNTLSTIYNYTIKFYDVETGKLVNSANERVSTVGFSEFENLETVKKSVLKKIKSFL
jgi:hypothetical protein